MDQTEFETIAKSFEAKRKQIAKTYLILLLVGIGLFVLALILLGVMLVNETANKVLGFIAVPSLIAGIILVVIACFKNQNFKKNFLASIKQKAMDSLFPDRIDEPKKCMALDLIMAPGFFSRPDRYLGSGYMSSTYNGIPFEKATYDLQKMETHSDGKHTYVDYVTYASGTMYHFAFQRDFGQIVKVMEKSGMSFFGSQGLSAVETEYILFNRKFKILASDETTVFYLLTPQIQEKVMELEGYFKGSFYMAFIGNELYIAVNDNGSSIKVKLMKPITEEVVKSIFTVYAIPSIFINLLGLAKNKFKKNAGASPS